MLEYSNLLQEKININKTKFEILKIYDKIKL